MKRLQLPAPLWGGVRGGGREAFKGERLGDRANDQYAQTPTPSADASDPPHMGEGICSYFALYGPSSFAAALAKVRSAIMSAVMVLLVTSPLCLK